MTTRKQPQTPKKPASITPRHLADSQVKHAGVDVPVREYEPYIPLPGVIPESKVDSALAMDSTPYDILNLNMQYGEYSGFRGYPALAALSQQVEYSNMHSVMAEEATRNWIEVKSKKEGDPRIDEMENLLDKYKIKKVIHDAVYMDSEFGVGRIFIDTGYTENQVELETELYLDARKISKGSLKGFRVVDPTWIYPALYNTRWPLADNFYRPDAWFVMGATVHHSRFLPLITRPVPDILKPSYNFGGLSLTQLMEDYVLDWRDAKKNVIKILRTMRMRALKTDMDARLQEPGQFDNRIKMLVNYQENWGVLAMDTTEELIHIQTSMSEMGNILSSYQEQLCIPSRAPVLKLLGNQPAGLSSTGEGEMGVWHETISGIQDGKIRPIIEHIFKVIQLSEWGEIDENIHFDFKPLDEISEKEQAEIIEIRTRTVTTASDSQVISTEEARDALSSIMGSGFENLHGDFDGGGDGYEEEE